MRMRSAVFAQAMCSRFGAATRDDALYQAVSEGRRFAGTEHWLPLFHEKLETVSDYFEGLLVIADQAVQEAAIVRLEQVADHYKAREQASSEWRLESGAPYKPMPPELLYLSREGGGEHVLSALTQVSPFQTPDSCSAGSS